MFLKLLAAGKWRSDKRAPASSPTIVLTKYHVKTSWQEKFAEVLVEYVFNSLSAPGNIIAEAYYENGEPCIMWTMERWNNQTFYNDNKRSVAGKAVNALTKTGLASPVEVIFIKELKLFSKEVSGIGLPTSDQPVTIMLMIDVQAGTQDYFKSINHDLALAMHSEPGVLVFQFGQVFYHKTRFIIWKKFHSWEVFHYHLRSPALESVMKFLQTSVKDPPFEKGYHHLIPFPPQ